MEDHISDIVTGHLVIEKAKAESKVKVTLLRDSSYPSHFTSELSKDEITEASKHLRTELDIIMKKNRSGKLRRKQLLRTMKIHGHDLAKSLFKRQEHCKLLNILESIDVLCILDYNRLRIPWELLYVIPHNSRESSQHKFISDVVTIVRIPNPEDGYIDDTGILRTPLDFGKNLALVSNKIHDEVKTDITKERLEKFSFIELDSNELIFDTASGKDVICVLAHGFRDDNNPENAGVEMSMDEVRYTISLSRVMQFPINSFILLFSCHTQSSGIAASIAAHSKNSVLGASCEIITHETIESIKALDRLIKNSNHKMLHKLLREWYNEDPLLRRLFAYHGPWKVDIAN